MKPLAIGDQVAFSADFLHNTGQFAGEVPHARGEVLELLELGASTTVARIRWHNADLHPLVNTANLCRPWDPAFCRL